jgi:catechol 2,3-dioxygenase-like lactoylglutathione lyase family enzyme
MPTRRVIIDHLKIGVSDLERSRRFYAQALEPLGYRDLDPSSDEDPGREVSFGLEGVDDFAIYSEGYYGAFVLDPDGHNVEAVFHG